MHRLAILTAVFAIYGLSAADAAVRHKHKIRAVAPRAHVPTPAQPVSGNRPAWAAPQQCYTNDGYGRFLPCDVSDGR